ncbi:unnamed protein product [Gadus morhua 'NCC']
MMSPANAAGVLLADERRVSEDISSVSLVNTLSGWFWYQSTGTSHNKPLQQTEQDQQAEVRSSEDRQHEVSGGEANPTSWRPEGRGPEWGHLSSYQRPPGQETGNTELSGGSNGLASSSSHQDHVAMEMSFPEMRLLLVECVRV